MLSQKQLKTLQKDANDQPARGVGFLVDIKQVIPENALYEAIRLLADEGNLKSLTDIELQNRLITQSIALMSYQDFKTIQPYLFTYRIPVTKVSESLVVTPLPASQTIFEAVKRRGNRLFDVFSVPDYLDELLLMNELLENLDQDYNLEDFELLANYYEDENSQIQRREQSRTLEQGREV